MNEDELNRMLHTWDVGTNLPPSFQREVWQHIEAEKRSRLSLAVWLETFLWWLSKPLPAAAVWTMALAIGISASGMVKRTPHASPVEAYVHSINPLAKDISQ